MTSESGFTTFETPIGVCAIAWGPRGLVGVSLPDGGAAEARARMKKRLPDVKEAEPPASVRDAIKEILALLSGEKRMLREIVLDDAGVPDFHKRVYDVARAIPPGETLTYGEVAERLSSPGAARAVGAALGANPWPIVVPCHRILGAGGKTGGFSAPGGTTTKMRMLNIEGAKVTAAPQLFEDLPLVAPKRKKP